MDREEKEGTALDIMITDSPPYTGVALVFCSDDHGYKREVIVPFSRVIAVPPLEQLAEALE